MPRIRRFVTALLVLYGAAFLLAAQAAAFDHAAWDALLKKHVVVLHDGQASQVDYGGFKAQRGALKHYLSSAPTDWRLNAHAERTE